MSLFLSKAKTLQLGLIEAFLELVLILIPYPVPQLKCTFPKTVCSIPPILWCFHGKSFIPSECPFTVKTRYFVVINHVSVDFFKYWKWNQCGPMSFHFKRLVRSVREMKNEREILECSAGACERQPGKRAECPALCCGARVGICALAFRSCPLAAGWGRGPLSTPLRSLCLRSELIGWVLFSWL